MPKKEKRKTAPSKPVAPEEAKHEEAEPKKAKSQKAKPPKAKLAKVGVVAGGKAKTKKGSKTSAAITITEKAQLLSSETVYEGPLFRVQHDKLVEPSGKHSERDVIRHNGSVVILAIDTTQSKKDPWLVIERQYRHAANQYLWELPAGKLEAGEDPLAGAKRELEEETGYGAKKWSYLVEYYASPGFLGEAMKVFLAEGLIAGDARPEEDEDIEFRLVKLSDVLKMIEKGMILDGKTLTSVLLYARRTGKKRKK